MLQLYAKAASGDHKHKSPIGFPVGLLCCQVMNEITLRADVRGYER
jgi:hypothetical protein